MSEEAERLTQELQALVDWFNDAPFLRAERLLYDLGRVANPEADRDHEHQWVDVHNGAVESGEMCVVPGCGAVRAAHPEAGSEEADRLKEAEERCSICGEPQQCPTCAGTWAGERPDAIPEGIDLMICECGARWFGGNTKYCPSGHAYRFRTERYVRAVPLEAGGEEAEQVSCTELVPRDDTVTLVGALQRIDDHAKAGDISRFWLIGFLEPILARFGAGRAEDKPPPAKDPTQ